MIPIAYFKIEHGEPITEDELRAIPMARFPEFVQELCRKGYQQDMRRMIVYLPSTDVRN